MVNSYTRVVAENFDRVFVPPRLNEKCDPINQEIDMVFRDEYLTEMGVIPSQLFGAAALISAGQYDFVGIHFTACHQIADMLPSDIPKILFTHDLDAIVRKQKGNLHFGSNDYPVDVEMDRLRKFDLVTVLGPEDQQFVADNGPGIPTVIASYCPEIDRRIQVRESMRNLLYVGTDTPFKQLSFKWFYTYVWPTILARGFDGTLHVVGSISTYAKSLGIGSSENCQIHGVVDSLEPFILQSDLLISPYYYGAGIKTNILEAIAYGLPVATTKYGLTNSHFKPGFDILVADDASAFAELVLGAADHSVRSRLSRNGLLTIQKYHSLKSLQPMIDRTCSLVSEFSLASKNKPDDPMLKELEARVPFVLERIRETGHQTVALYGAGGHTKMLLEIWGRLSGPPIDCVFVTEKSIDTFEGYPVWEIKDIHERSIDILVTSSKLFEIVMAKHAYKISPETPICLIWNPDFDIQRASEMDMLDKDIPEQKMSEYIP